MTVVIADSIEIKSDRPGSEHAAGLVVVFPFGPTDAAPSQGCVVEIHTPSERFFELLIDEAKEHGSARSFFFRDLHKSDVPLGSRIVWSDDSSKWHRRVGKALVR